MTLKFFLEDAWHNSMIFPAQDIHYYQLTVIHTACIHFCFEQGLAKMACTSNPS